LYTVEIYVARKKRYAGGRRGNLGIKPRNASGSQPPYTKPKEYPGELGVPLARRA